MVRTRSGTGVRLLVSFGLTLGVTGGCGGVSERESTAGNGGQEGAAPPAGAGTSGTRAEAGTGGGQQGGGTSGSAGSIVGNGGTSGNGGTNTGSGGSIAGNGGASGGTTPGGGTNAGYGGASAGDGGTNAGSGGTNAGGRNSAGYSGTDGGNAGSPEFSTSPAFAFSLMLGPPNRDQGPTPGTRSCNAGTLGSFTYAVGEPDPGGTIEDGTNGANVACLVGLDADGSGMDVSATMSGIDANGNKPVSAVVTSYIAPGDTTASATLAFVSPDTGSLTSVLTGFPSCTLGPIVVVKPGALLADIDCPLIGAADDDTSGCAVHGTIAIEYCATSAAAGE